MIRKAPVEFGDDRCTGIVALITRRDQAKRGVPDCSDPQTVPSDHRTFISFVSADLKFQIHLSSIRLQEEMTMQWLMPVLLGLGLGARCVVSQSEPEPTTKKIFPYDYKMRDLDNGLRVVIVPTDYPNLVSFQIPVQVGSRNEVDEGLSGFAHFFEHLMFRGTESYSKDEYNAFYKSIGAATNAYTNDDMTNYHSLLAKEDLEQALLVEADRFMNVQFSEDEFKTEAKAVLGEFNKNSNSPTGKLLAAIRNVAFTKHPYKHTTMGFLEDIMDMPNQYEYSWDFYSRFYRPEYIMIILAGDLDADETFTLVEKYWGGWERGNYVAEIPQEGPVSGPIYEHVEWPSPTLPWVTVSFRGPAFSDSVNDMATMDVLFTIFFSSSSPIYQKLVVNDQTVDSFFAYYPDRKDPSILTVFAKAKNIDDIWYVKNEIMKTFADIRVNKVSEDLLNGVKSNLKYSFANSMDSSESIAKRLVGYMGRTRDPETINKVHALYDSITTDDIISKANSYFTDENMIVTTMAFADDSMPKLDDSDTTSLEILVNEILQQGAQEPPKSLLLKNDSPVINFRILFNIGAADDPEGKEGLAKLTANMISYAGSMSMSYENIQKAMFPLASRFGNQVDKEMTVFSGTTHSDNLNDYYEIISKQLLTPGWADDDFERVKSSLINSIESDLKGSNDEELGKEVLYEVLYADHPYGHLNKGHVAALESMTLEDVRTFYQQMYTRANLVLGIAGKFSDEFLDKIYSDLNNGLPVEFTLPPDGGLPIDVKQAADGQLPAPLEAEAPKAAIVEKETRSTAVSFGFPIAVTRSHPDFAALWLARSYLGEHRTSNGLLMQRLRGVRGLNYGSYAYIEYYPRGMYLDFPLPNLGRQQQIFQVWLRPLETIENAHFATRAAMFELDRMINEGISEDKFEETQSFLLKYVNLMVGEQWLELGYALDSQYYNIGEFTSYMASELEKLTLEQVNAAIKKHLQGHNPTFVFITKDAEELRDKLINEETSTMTYQVEMPADVLEEDKIIQDLKLNINEENAKIVPIADVFVDSNAFKDKSNDPAESADDTVPTVLAENEPTETADTPPQTNSDATSAAAKPMLGICVLFVSLLSFFAKIDLL